MSLNGIGNLPPGVLGGAPLTHRPGTIDRQRPNGDAAVPAPASPPTRAGHSQAATGAREVLSAKAPAGTDPELWKVLTSEERQHFAAAGARGPLTYGYLARSQAPQSAPVSRGVRLDLKA
jgi:hypothetical protein